MLLTVVPVFPLCPPLPSPPPLSQATPTSWFMSAGQAYMFLGYSIPNAVLYILMAIP